MKLRTLASIVAIAWLVIMCCYQPFAQQGWRECCEFSDLLAKWSWTYYWRGAMASLLVWHLVGGYKGGRD
jgi:hypothetical protein